MKEKKYVTDNKTDISSTLGNAVVHGADTEYIRPQYSDSKTVASTVKVGAYGANKPVSQTKTSVSTIDSDYDEFYLSGQKSIYNRLTNLGNAWLAARDESVRNELHADDIFQMYNPGSKGHGKKVGNYVNAFYNYYKAVGR